MNSRITNIPSELVATPGIAHKQVTIGATVVDLADSPTAGSVNPLTTHIWFNVIGEDIRVTADGSTDPSATVGFFYADGTSAIMRKDAWNSMKAIRNAAADAVLAFQEMTH